MSTKIYKRRLWKEASLSITDSAGGTWKRRAFPYGSSARGTWKEGFFTGVSEIYVKGGSDNGHLSP